MRRLVYKLLRTNRGVRVLVGALLVAMGLLMFLVPSGAKIREERARTIDLDQIESERHPVIELAKTNHLALLERCMEEWEQKDIGSYTCTFKKQERIGDDLRKRQVIAVKFRPEPFSVAMTWKENPPTGDTLVYVAGKYGDKNGKSQMVVRPANILLRKLVGGSVKRLPDCKTAMKNTLRPCTEFGFANSLRSLYDVYREGHERGECEDRYGGVAEIAGRQCVVLERYLNGDRPSYPAYKTLAYIDLEHLIPLRIDGYDRNGELLCYYQFDDINFNAGLSDDDFTPAANGIATK